MLRPEALVHRAVPLPEEEGGLLAVGLVEPAELLAGVPHPHVLVAVAHGQPGVAAEVLVREEEDLVALVEGPPSTAPALVDVHTAPPLRPTNAFERRRASSCT